jgi:hypothetical protein
MTTNIAIASYKILQAWAITTTTRSPQNIHAEYQQKPKMVVCEDIRKP